MSRGVNRQFFRSLANRTSVLLHAVISTVGSGNSRQFAPIMREHRLGIVLVTGLAHTARVLRVPRRRTSRCYHLVSVTVSLGVSIGILVGITAATAGTRA